LVLRRHSLSATCETSGNETLRLLDLRMVRRLIFISLKAQLCNVHNGSPCNVFFFSFKLYHIFDCIGRHETQKHCSTKKQILSFRILSFSLSDSGTVTFLFCTFFFPSYILILNATMAIQIRLSHSSLELYPNKFGA
uniref:Ovule protein n=1 Tax=Brugia timori TaxID=42155 RepID=A0A0R3Q3S5_9BILA